jgi:outer membrane lipoprotein-sorting protein
MHVLIAVLITCLFAGLPARGHAQDPVMDIVKNLKEALEPPRPSTRQVVLTMTAGGETVRWVARQAYKQFPDGKRMVMVLLEPAGVKGNAYLVWEPKDKPSAVWTYLPFLRRVRELVPVDAYEHFLGTDFTYADLGFIRLHPQYRLLGQEEHGGKQTYKIEEAVPQERAYYSRVITWVAKDALLPLQRDYYDVAGTLWKTELFEVEMIDGVPTPLRIRMTDVQTGNSTELNISEVRYDVEIPDDVFDPKGLPQVATQPLWQATNSRVAINPEPGVSLCRRETVDALLVRKENENAVHMWKDHRHAGIVAVSLGDHQRVRPRRG